MRFDFALEAADVTERFRSAVEAQIQVANDETLRVVRSLTPIQFAVLRVMAASGAAYAPFEAVTLAKYKQAIQQAGDDNVSVEVPAIQQALIALQEKSLIWRASRGVYAIEDSTLTDLLKERGLLENF